VLPKELLSSLGVQGGEQQKQGKQVQFMEPQPQNNQASAQSVSPKAPPAKPPSNDLLDFGGLS